MISSDIIIIAVVGFFSGLIKTGVGVGAGLFLLPTLALAFPAKTALGLGAPLMLVSDIIGLRYYWKQWLPRVELTRLFLAALPGLILGVLVLPLIPGAIFRTGVGFFGVLYALGLLWPRFPVAALLKKLFGGLTARAGPCGRTGLVPVPDYGRARPPHLCGHHNHPLLCHQHLQNHFLCLHRHSRSRRTAESHTRHSHDSSGILFRQYHQQKMQLSFIQKNRSLLHIPHFHLIVQII